MKKSVQRNTGKGSVRYWLMKSEPSCYSIDDLKRQKVGMWDGVRNYQARNLMRDEMRVGDTVLFYHSSEQPIGIVGIAEIAKEAYPDPTQFDPKSDHYDPTAREENPRWVAVDVRFVKKCARMLTLTEIKNDPVLKDMIVAQRGSRLSIQPVSEKHFLKVMSYCS